MHHFEDGFVNSRFGRLHYLTAGTGEALILLHSNGGSAYEYEEVIEGFSKNFRVIAWDMPGQGDSDPLLKHISVEDYADAVIDMMDGLKIDKAYIAGDSIGGAICVALGAHHADRCLSLSVIECPFRTPAEWKSNWLNTEANYAPVTQTIDRVAPRLKNVTPEFMVRWNIDRAKAGSKTCLSVMWALREYDMARDLPKVPANQQVVYGTKGPTIAKKKEMMETIRDASLVIMEGSGHFPMLDDPEGFIATISSFIATTKK